MHPRLLDLAMTARTLHHLMADFKRLKITHADPELQRLGEILTREMRREQEE